MESTSEYSLSYFVTLDTDFELLDIKWIAGEKIDYIIIWGNII